MFNKYKSFCWSQVHDIPRENPSHGYYGALGKDGVVYYHHPGFAWAARKESLNKLGGLIDWAVVGEADNTMAKALVGEVEDTFYPGASYNYNNFGLDWQFRALKYIRKNIGYINGTLVHRFHGPKAKRQYWTRRKILSDTGFDPTIHIKKDWQGLWQLEDRGDDNSIKLRDAIRSYFLSRDEDNPNLN